MTILAIVGIIICVNMFLKNIRENYTAERPKEFQQIATTPSQELRLKKTYNTLRNSIENNREETITIESKDINQFLNGAPETQSYVKYGRFTMEDNLLKADMSIPLDSLNYNAFKGRYLNGIFTYHFSIDNGVIDVKLLSCDISGREVPKTIQDALNKQDWNMHMKASVLNNIIHNIDSLKIENGSMKIKTKGK